MKKDVQQHVANIVTHAIKPTGTGALIVFDRQSALASILTDAYRGALPHAQLVDFDTVEPETIFAAIDALVPGDLVVLVQSTSFRLHAFRFRLELFKRGMAVIEHPHLGRIPENEMDTYCAALAYDPTYYHGLGHAMRKRIDAGSTVVVECEETRLTYTGGFEDAKINIGDYTEMKNKGGQFPIGEVFTEPKEMANVNGEVMLYAFGNQHARTVVPAKPFKAIIREGLLVEAPDAPQEFQDILAQISETEPVWVRELGFGMNRALTRTQTLSDVGSYERMCGVHVSLGQKHTIYKKPGMHRRKSKYHVDVFVDVQRVYLDGNVVFEDGRYIDDPTWPHNTCTRCRDIPSRVFIDFLDSGGDDAAPVPSQIWELPDVDQDRMSSGYKEWEVTCELCQTHYRAEVDVEPMVHDFTLTRLRD